MLIDRFGAGHSRGEPAAILAFESAVHAIAAHRPMGRALQDALSLDEEFLSARTLLGLAHVILARTETIDYARDLLPDVEARLVRRGVNTPSERVLVQALRLSVGGSLRAAADALELHVRSHPHDLLSIKLAHSLRFMAGQSKEMLAFTRALVPQWSPANCGYGFLLGCHAFGLEECGLYTHAEAAGREAYAHERSDAWGLHAVSHVMEMSGRTEEGATWLEQSRHDWSQCNNFSFHLGWHLALLRLEQGDLDVVLDIYDREIRQSRTDDFRDIANATSILWRLELEGLPVGDRWVELHEMASRRRSDLTYVFGALHYLLAMSAAGDISGAEDILSAMRLTASDLTRDQGRVAAEVGVPLAEVILSVARGDNAACDLIATAAKLSTLGGSHAQRDVFLRTLLMVACRRGDTVSVIALSRIRHRLRATDRFSFLIEDQMRRRGMASSKFALEPSAA